MQNADSPEPTNSNDPYLPFENIRVVLINTFHPGNIGSAIRAMKTMGLKHLYLVDPEDFPSEQAVAMAAGARPELEQAIVVSSLDEAIADCSVVIGASARNRTLSLPQLSSRECGKHVVQAMPNNKIALVFGREKMGLHNDELQRCNFHVYIPGNEAYPILNLAMAVHTLCYEIRMTHLEQKDAAFTPQSEEYPNSRETGFFYEHLEETLSQIGFLSPKHHGMTMPKLKRLFNRARPEKNELNILRGILSRVQKRCSDSSTQAQD